MSSTSLCLCLASCSPVVDARGYTLSDVDRSQIIEGQSGTEDVRALLGSPSATSGFGNATWYYISSRKETLGFFAPEVAEQNVLAIHFDEAGLVDRVEQYDQSQSRPVEFVSKETPTEGHEMTVLEQMLGNFGRFNAPGREIDPRNLGR